MRTSYPQEAQQAGQGALWTPSLLRDLKRFVTAGRARGHHREREREIQDGGVDR